MPPANPTSWWSAAASPGLAAARELGRSGCRCCCSKARRVVGGKLRLGDGRRRRGRRRRRVDAGPAARGRRAGGRARARRGPSGRRARRSSGPAARCGRCPRTLLGVPLDLDATWRDRACSPTTASRGPRTRPCCPLADRRRVGRRAARARGSGTRSSTGWPSRCSAACTPVTPTTCRAAAAAPQVVAMLREHGSLLAAAAALPPPSAPPRCSPASSAGSAGCRCALAETGGVEVRTSAHRARARADGVRLPADRRLDPRPGDARDRARWCWPPRARPPPGCSPTSRRRRPRSSARSSTRRWRWSRSPCRPLEVGDSSGFLVPPVDGRRIKASTYSFPSGAGSATASDLRILRASIGRHREEASLQATDEELVAHVVADLALATGQAIAARSTPTSSAGAARCRSTPSATSTGWPGSGPRSPPCPGWRCAARRTTVSASRP